MEGIDINTALLLKCRTPCSSAPRHSPRRVRFCAVATSCRPSFYRDHCAPFSTTGISFRAPARARGEEALPEIHPGECASAPSPLPVARLLPGSLRAVQHAGISFRAPARAGEEGVEVRSGVGGWDADGYGERRHVPWQSLRLTCTWPSPRRTSRATLRRAPCQAVRNQSSIMMTSAREC